MREYLFNADIYKGRNRMSKNEFVEMIITGKPKLLNILTEKKNYQKKTLLNYLKNNMLIDFKKHWQSLSLSEQIYAINHMIDFISTANIDINKKFNMIKELKEIRQKLLLD